MKFIETLDYGSNINDILEKHPKPWRLTQGPRTDYFRDANRQEIPLTTIQMYIMNLEALAVAENCLELDLYTK